MTDFQARSRPLTGGERALATSVFGTAIDYDPVRMVRRAWWPFQPRNIVMAPCGNIHFHRKSELWSHDFAREHPLRQGLFIHEMTHVWQAQSRGKYYLPLMRHPFCRYRYSLRPGWPFERYGLEQQAEIVRHVFLLRNGHRPAASPPLAELEPLLPFSAKCV
jgi:hypothetical protein